jgi:hypothetical protein
MPGQGIGKPPMYPDFAGGPFKPSFGLSGAVVFAFVFALNLETLKPVKPTAASPRLFNPAFPRSTAN